MRDSNLWLRAKSIHIQTPADIVPGFNIGFDSLSLCESILWFYHYEIDICYINEFQKKFTLCYENLIGRR